ncbi:hypothetical protein GCM10008955_09690 [Deinococcus malanensis]|uniref:Uncharacterized protein n=2 Tax=Deinococcus malanensis TaxID=1706855 RepID=A0ABQ2EP86_9DEIO|nr:hypothetical protein GCM10008955_09690 [Deinococcus malanensis]
MAALAGIGLGTVFVLFKEFKLLSFDPTYAATLGYPTGRLGALLTSLAVVAVMIGLQTVGSVQLLERSGRVMADAAIGVVFPLLFSLYFRDVHLDLDAVLYGEIAYAPLNTLMLGGARFPSRCC